MTLQKRHDKSNEQYMESEINKIMHFVNIFAECVHDTFVHDSIKRKENLLCDHVKSYSDHIKPLSNDYAYHLHFCSNLQLTVPTKLRNCIEKIEHVIKSKEGPLLLTPDTLSTSILNNRLSCTKKAVPSHDGHMNKKVEDHIQKGDYPIFIQYYTKGSHYATDNNTIDGRNSKSDDKNHSGPDNPNPDGNDIDDNNSDPVDNDHNPDNNHADPDDNPENYPDGDPDDDPDDDDDGDDDDDDDNDDDDDDDPDDEDGDDDPDDDPGGNGPDFSDSGGGDNRGCCHLFCLVMLFLLLSICLLSNYCYQLGYIKNGNSNMPLFNLVVRAMCSPNGYHNNVTAMDDHYSDSILTSVNSSGFQLTHQQQTNQYKLPPKFAGVESQYASSLIPWGLHLETCPSGKLIATSNTLQCTVLDCDHCCFINCHRAAKFKTANKFLTDYNFCVSATFTTVTEKPVKLIELTSNPLCWNSVQFQSRKVFKFGNYSVYKTGKLKVNALIRNWQDYGSSSLSFSHDIRLCVTFISTPDIAVSEDMAMLNHLTIKTRWKYSLILSSLTDANRCWLVCTAESVLFYRYTTPNFCNDANLCHNCYSSEKVVMNDLISLLNSESSMKFRCTKIKILSHNKAKNTDVTGLVLHLRTWYLVDSSIVSKFHSKNCARYKHNCITTKIPVLFRQVVISGQQLVFTSLTLHQIYKTPYYCHCIPANYDLQYFCCSYCWNIPGVAFPHYSDPPALPSLLLMMNTHKLHYILCNANFEGFDTKRTVLFIVHHHTFDILSLILLPLPFNVLMTKEAEIFHTKRWCLLCLPHYSDPPLKLSKNQIYQNIFKSVKSMFEVACDSKRLFSCLKKSQKLSWIHLQQLIYIEKYNDAIKSKYCHVNAFFTSNSIAAVFRIEDNADITILSSRTSKSFNKYARLVETQLDLPSKAYVHIVCAAQWKSKDPEISKAQSLFTIILHGSWKSSFLLQLERCSTSHSNEILPQHIPSNSLLIMTCKCSTVTDQMLLTNRYNHKIMFSTTQIQHCYHPPWHCSWFSYLIKFSCSSNVINENVIYAFIWQQAVYGNSNSCTSHKWINKNLLVDKGKSVTEMQSDTQLINKQSFSIIAGYNLQFIFSRRYANTLAINKLRCVIATETLCLGVMDNYKHHDTDSQLNFPHYSDPPSAVHKPCWMVISSRDAMFAFHWAANILCYKKTYKPWDTECDKIATSYDTALNFPHYCDPPHHNLAFQVLTDCYPISNFDYYTDHYEGTIHQSLTCWKILQTLDFSEMKSNKDQCSTISDVLNHFWCSIIWTITNKVYPHHQMHCQQNVSKLMNFPHYCDPPMCNFHALLSEYRNDYSPTNKLIAGSCISTTCNGGTIRNEDFHKNSFKPLEENDTKLLLVEFQCHLKKWNWIMNCTRVLMLLNPIANLLGSDIFDCNEFDTIGNILQFPTSLSIDKQHCYDRQLLCRLTYPWRNKHWTYTQDAFPNKTVTKFPYKECYIVTRRKSVHSVTLSGEKQSLDHLNYGNKLVCKNTTYQSQQVIWILYISASSVIQNVFDLLNGNRVVILGTILLTLWCSISALIIFTVRMQDNYKRLSTENQTNTTSSWSNSSSLLQDSLSTGFSNERGILDFAHENPPIGNSSLTPLDPTVYSTSNTVQVPVPEVNNDVSSTGFTSLPSNLQSSILIKQFTTTLGTGGNNDNKAVHEAELMSQIEYGEETDGAIQIMDISLLSREELAFRFVEEDFQSSEFNSRRLHEHFEFTAQDENEEGIGSSGFNSAQLQERFEFMVQDENEEGIGSSGFNSAQLQERFELYPQDDIVSEDLIVEEVFELHFSSIQDTESFAYSI